MDLKCFGGGKCPDWVLSGLFSCSKLDAANAKTICVAIASHAAGETLDVDEFKSILAKHGLKTTEEVQLVMASVLYVLRTCARWDSDSAQLAAGMRTIRISTHMIRGLRTAFDEYGTEIGSKMRRQGLTLTKLVKLETTPPPEGAVGCLKLNMSIKDCIENKIKDHSILIHGESLLELVKELKKTRKYME